MFDPQLSIEISGTIKREGIDRLIIDHVIRYTRGGYPKEVSLINSSLETTNVNKEIIKQKYDSNTGIYRTWLTVTPENDPDVNKVYSVSGSYQIKGNKYPIPFTHTEKLSRPEPNPVITQLNKKVEDGYLIINMILRRDNGKIPERAIVENTPLKCNGLSKPIVAKQCYNPIDGTLSAYYEVGTSRELEITLETRVKLNDEQEGSLISFSEMFSAGRSIDFKVVSKSVKDGLLTIASKVRWKDTGEIPSSFNLVTPFLYASHSSNGVANIISSFYNSHVGLYEFKVKIDCKEEGIGKYHFITKTKAEDYPEAQVDLTIEYNFQSEYNAEIKSVIVSDGKLKIHWSIESVETPNYKLENLSVPDLLFGTNILGSNKPTVDYFPELGELTTTWDILIDDSRKMSHNYYGYFIIDNKEIPWNLDFSTSPIVVTKSILERADNDNLTFNVSFNTDGKIIDTDLSNLVLLVNRIPTVNRIVKHQSTNSRIVLGSVQLKAPSDEVVEVEVLGSILINDGVIRKLPVHLKMIDFIPTPTEGLKFSYKVIEHNVVGDVEKLVIEPSLNNNTRPSDVILKGNKVNINNVNYEVSKCSYKNGLLTILTKFKPTGLKEVHNLVGELSLPGYEGNPAFEIRSSLTFGSDTFPASLEQINSATIKQALIFGVKVLLKNGKSPKSVKIKSAILGPNVVNINNIANSEEFNSETSILSFNVRCIEVKDIALDYGLGISVEINDGESTVIQSIRLNHKEEPKFKGSVKYLGYDVKDNKLVFKHLLDINKDLPKTVEPKDDVPDFNYDCVTGLITHTAKLDDLNKVRSFNIVFDIGLPGTWGVLPVATGDVNYGPAAKATYHSHEFRKDGTLIYRWQFKDAAGLNPKLVRINDFMKNNINIDIRTIDLNYDRNTGIGYVVGKAIKKKGNVYYADAKFQFPSPDPLFYPLVIDLKV